MIIFIKNLKDLFCGTFSMDWIVTLLMKYKRQYNTVVNKLVLSYIGLNPVSVCAIFLNVSVPQILHLS